MVRSVVQDHSDGNFIIIVTMNMITIIMKLHILPKDYVVGSIGSNRERVSVLGLNPSYNV